MAVLVGYDSSDEEEEAVALEKTETKKPADETLRTEQAAAAVEDAGKGAEPERKIVDNDLAQAGTGQAEPEPTIGPVQQSAVPLGPSLPPMDLSLTIPDELEPSQEPLSPYSANRALIQNLTLPSVPNVNIPDSPPGSPPASITKKFEHFLDLKKKGVHFNAKLEHSSALKNPSIMDTMIQFDGVGDPVQYETTLSTDLWDPKCFPGWATSTQLAQSRSRIAKERAGEQATGGRSSIDFVPALTPTGGGTSSSGGTSKGEKRKAGWR